MTARPSPRSRRKASASTGSRRRPARRPCCSCATASRRPRIPTGRSRSATATAIPRSTRSACGRPSCSPTGSQHEPIAAIYVTTLHRTHQTAAPLAARLGLTPIEEPDLREVFLGEWEGGELPRARRRQRPDLRADLRAGTLGRDPRRRAARRVRRARLARLPAHRRRAPRRDASMVVAHGGVIGQLLHRVTDSRRFAFSGRRQRVDQRGRRRRRPHHPAPLQRRRASPATAAQSAPTSASQSAPGAPHPRRELELHAAARRRGSPGSRGCTPRRCCGMRVEVVDPRGSRAARRVNARAELGRELAVRAAEQAGGPAVVVAAQAAEAVHRDDDVDVLEERDAARPTARGRSDATGRASACRRAARPRRSTRSTRPRPPPRSPRCPPRARRATRRNPNDEPSTQRSSTPGVASSWSSTAAPASAQRVDEQVAERRVLLRTGLLRQAEHALADDVALHLVGAAVDRRAGREQRELLHRCRRRACRDP